MAISDGPIIEMTPRGEFVDRPAPGLGRIAARLAAFGVLLLIAAVAFWAALFVIPVLLALAFAGYLVARQKNQRGFVVLRR